MFLEKVISEERIKMPNENLSQHQRILNTVGIIVSRNFIQLRSQEKSLPVDIFPSDDVLSFSRMQLLHSQGA